ncbi:nudix hydrolase 20 [Crucibulum laeve]|uniref:Nudix hydrolase 20 n=1 Tax=Crucibulum laeve TaxID=68775 RepID=A0A5C3LES9_9AGAR|nr:nudix hydrolase 20 [Crucibulum laeve]
MSDTEVVGKLSSLDIAARDTQTTPKPRANLSFLDIVDICDNVRIPQSSEGLSPFDREALVPLYLNESVDSPVIGLLRPAIIEQLKLENERNQQLNLPELWNLRLRLPLFRILKSGILGPSVSFRDWVDTPSKRTTAMKEVCERWRDTELFEDVCGPKKWRSEMYPIYADPFGVHDYPDGSADETKLNYIFEMERSACALFGVITYGVHMNIYEEAEISEGKELRVWVPTRARTKQTWPGYLDNSVAGGIPSGMSPFESLVKECMEEASLEADIVRKHTRCVGAISYFFRTAKGWLQPEIEYVYDLVIPPGADPTPFEPKPLDGEVESFELLSQDKVIRKLREGVFKPNCALVLIDLFIRLGYVTPDNEPEFMKIVTRLHGRFNYERW